MTNLGISDLRGSGTFFNNADLGLLLVHGTYGTSFDTTPGHQVKQMYFPIASGGSAQYLRMSEMSLGGSSPTNGLKWMAFMACTSLYQQNWNSMKSQGVKPYNSNLHMILGCATDFARRAAHRKVLGGLHARNRSQDIEASSSDENPGCLVRGRKRRVQTDSRFVTAPNPTVLAVVADGNCTEDYLQTNSVPSGGTWSYYNSRTGLSAPMRKLLLLALASSCLDVGLFSNPAVRESACGPCTRPAHESGRALEGAEAPMAKGVVGLSRVPDAVFTSGHLKRDGVGSVQG